MVCLVASGGSVVGRERLAGNRECALSDTGQATLLTAGDRRIDTELSGAVRTWSARGRDVKDSSRLLCRSGRSCGQAGSVSHGV